MFEAIVLAVSIASAFAYEFNKVLIKGGDIDTSIAPNFLEEPLKLNEFQHLSADQRLSLELEFPFLVHLTEEALREYSLDQLRRRFGGIDLSNYIPYNTFLVSITHLRAFELSKDPEVVDWIGNLHPENKLCKSIKRFDSSRMNLNELVVELSPQDSESEVERVMLDLLDRAAKHKFSGIEGRIASKSRFNLRLHNLEHVELAEFLSYQAEVFHIHRNFPVELADAFAKTIIWEGKDAPVPISELRTTRNKLDGQGQVVGVADAGLSRHSCFFRQPTFRESTAFKICVSNITENDLVCTTDFSNRKIIQYVGCGDYEDNNGHGTHVTGSIVGSLESEHANSDLSHFQGMAPEAKVAFFDLGVEGSSDLKFPDDLQTGMFNWAHASSARVHSNSWGNEEEGGYDGRSKDADDFMWKNKDFLIVFAVGNGGYYGRKKSVYCPGCGKNVLTVGATLNSRESFRKFQKNIEDDPVFEKYWESNPEDFSSESVAPFSSIGPTEDNRIKPDVTAPGYYIASAKNVAKNTQCDSPVLGETISIKYGTSFATPQVSGSALLIRQYFMDGFFPSGIRNQSNAFSPSASLIKAVIINSAVNMKGVKFFFSKDYSIWSERLKPRPSITQGFGRVSLDSVLLFANEPTTRSTFIPSLNASAADVFFDSSLETGQYHTFKYCTKNGSFEELRVTLVWTDAPVSSNSDKQLVNDLDLTVQVGASMVLKGNAQGSYRDEVRGTFRTGKDDVNTVESVYFTPELSDDSVNIIVRVNASKVPFGPQPYSLVISGAITEGECGSEFVSKPAITKNSVIDQLQSSTPSNVVSRKGLFTSPTPSSPACKYSYPIDATEDPSSNPFPTSQPAPDARAKPFVIIVCAIAGSFVLIILIAIFATILIRRFRRRGYDPVLSVQAE